MNTTEPITIPHVGSRVWTIDGLHQHGPEEGPKINVAANTGGRITSVGKPSYALHYGKDLYSVQWDSGQVSKHYLAEFGKILSIGPFETLHTFETAFGTAKNATATLGPNGGLREFRANVCGPDGRELTIRFIQEQTGVWSYVEALAKRMNVTVTATRLPRRTRGRAARAQ